MLVCCTVPSGILFQVVNCTKFERICYARFGIYYSALKHYRVDRTLFMRESRNLKAPHARYKIARGNLSKNLYSSQEVAGSSNILWSLSVSAEEWSTAINSFVGRYFWGFEEKIRNAILGLSTVAAVTKYLHSRQLCKVSMKKCNHWELFRKRNILGVTQKCLNTNVASRQFFLLKTSKKALWIYLRCWFE